jgi:predicted metal-dependent hydrolase
MSVRHVEVPGFGAVRVYKRRDSRALKVSIDHNDQIRVSMPTWLPYRAAIEFIRNKESWITAHRRPLVQLEAGQAVGKAHRIEFNYSASAQQASSRIIKQSIRVSLPAGVMTTDERAQLVAQRGAVSALRQEATTLLPIRLRQLAQQYDFTYSSVRIKQLRSRWGSCNEKKHITLNLFLMQLPWPLIDYVLLHELSHTIYPHHGQDFWLKLESCLPNAKQLRKQLKTFQPQL